ncbi:MAG: L-serine ammonia-lyase [Pseudomonadota bacterium]
MLSVLDIFRVGIGPSSSHTVGPMRISRRFIDLLCAQNAERQVKKIKVVLQGSLAFTGKGHATDTAVVYGLCGFRPETMDPGAARAACDRVYSSKALQLHETNTIAFDPATDIVFDYDTVPALHPNGMRLIAYGHNGAEVLSETYYSTGGGFVATQAQLEKPATDDIIDVGRAAPHPFTSGEELLGICSDLAFSIEGVIRANEEARRSKQELDAGLDRVAEVMMASIDRGLETEGLLPGHLKVQRRAPALWSRLQGVGATNERESLFDWLNVYAMAVNEENAGGGQVVTAPTNGAAGVIPSVIRHYCMGGDFQRSKVRRFLLTAGGIGILYKQRASISGAEMGCQGEVGVACSMAAAGLAAVWGGNPSQVACAAEIGMEHNLGLTCDPVGGLVQVPCIERNAIGAVKAANAARLALHGTGHAKVSLDTVIETMRQTGLDMSTKYKETSQGGLAVNVVEC